MAIPLRFHPRPTTHLLVPSTLVKSTMTRQLAPTVGAAVSGVTFRAGILGEIGSTITVGSLEFDGNVGHFINNDTYMPAQNHLVSACVLPIGSANIFIGLTTEAMGFRGGSKRGREARNVENFQMR